MEGPEIKFAEAVIDNGSFGTRTVRFETGRLARQAAGSASVYLDQDTMVLSATAETETAAGGTAGRRAQNRRARLGLRLRPGRGAWRRTLPFR